MNLDLGGQTAVIVGGANGIGRAIAEAFAAEGTHIGLIDLSPTVTASAAEIAERFDAWTHGVRADVTDLAAISNAADLLLENLGPANHVVYAAGAGSGQFGFPFWNIDPAVWSRVLNINLIGAVNVAHHYSPRLIAQPGGTLLFIASIAGQIGSQTDPPYSAAKAGLINFAMCAAKDLAPHGVRVNSICPGMVRTDLNRSVWQAWNDKQPEADRLDYEAWGASKVKSVAPMGRWQEASEIGAAAVFLASENAKNITGQTINVDGGQVMHW